MKFSDWAAPIVPVMSNNGQVHICGNYRLTVNEVSKLDVYPLPHIDDLLATLSGGEVFSELNLNNAYQQLLLDEESKKYTIHTTKGLFQY